MANKAGRGDLFCLFASWCLRNSGVGARLSASLETGTYFPCHPQLAIVLDIRSPDKMKKGQRVKISVKLSHDHDFRRTVAAPASSWRRVNVARCAEVSGGTMDCSENGLLPLFVSGSRYHYCLSQLSFLGSSALVWRDIF